MNDSDADLYRRRVAQERSAAIASGDGAAALAHLQLAEAYDKLVAIAGSDPGPDARGYSPSPAMRN